ncbi:WXG100 family type VII secretion target [Nonomuraea basaltis]|uniref:WXG100 family type VII secretion target n=1 Tax=Nonomuraea basaltis TaxID=2495887 RepID=UPI00110C46DE|nr:hypothetical protein [Nonomuraea basaltis]TMR96080.1 hypothetical protein EJK15_25025 [Nonomuraea basaltis]
MAERQVVVILSFDRSPKGEWPKLEASEIKRLLQSTDSATIQGNGQSYKDVASKIQQAIKALEDHAPKIADVWKGPDASKARHALEMLHASGNELSSKLSMMGGALQTYAGQLNDTKTKANEAVSVPGATQMTQSEEDIVREGLEKVQAQRALYDLNQQIVNILTVEVPHDVSYELPTVSIPSAPPETRDTNYPTGTSTDGPTFTPLSDNGGGSGYYGGGGSGGPGSGAPTPGGSVGGSTPGGSDPGGSNPGGSNPGGSNPGGSTPGGSNPDGSSPGSPADPDPNNPANPGDPGSPTTPPTTPDPGQTQNPGPGNGDGTVPPVIGDQNRTTTDGTNITDPRQTDMASYQPPTATIAPPATTISPPPSVTVPTPMGGGSPGVPSVIGSPGFGGQSPLTASGRGTTGAPGGMPFMPFMGGAGAGSEVGDLERNTYVPEDASCWATNHETTDPVIG